MKKFKDGMKTLPAIYQYEHTSSKNVPSEVKINYIMYHNVNT